MLRSEAIKKLLEAKTHADLAILYSKNMEVQFNVAQDNGDRIEEDYKGRTFHSYTDGINKWSHFRIPRNAKTEPIDNDCPVHGDIYQHAEGVGMTGWDWYNRVSRWVAYDFDAMTGHSDKHEKKMTDDELQQLRDVVSAIPWVTIRLSTSGKGIHLYVFLEPVATQNHTEHAALARAILGLMASITGYDFQSKVDTCGGNMWVWHRKMTDTKGLTVVKQGEILTEIPQNWRDHIRVVSGASRRTLPSFVTENKEANPNLEDMFEEVTGTKTLIPLDAEHKRLIAFLHEGKACAWWDQDHHMLVTHTVHLQEAFNKLGLKGVFKTNAKGENYGSDHNCFCYPLRRGGWAVRRYTPGVAEESTWDQDGQGWTRCLGAETEVLTKNGIFTIEELALIGEATLYVLTPEGPRWIKCKVKSFGKQKLVNLKIRTGIQLRATLNHQWLYVSSNGKFNLGDRKNTYELVKDTRLPLLFQQLPSIDFEGYAHGFVFGDGWLHHRGYQTDVELYGDKDNLLPLLLKYGIKSTREKYGETINCVRRLPNTWKMLPSFQDTKEYIFGFILGLISADANVGDTVTIKNKFKSNLENVRKLCQHIGLRVYKVNQVEDCFTLAINTHNLKKEYFLRKSQREQLIIAHTDAASSVLDVDYLGTIEEEVFCAEVPFYNNFTLACGIVTGNCYLNRELDLATACRSFNANEDESGGYVFREAEVAAKAAALLGIELGVPAWAGTRPTLIKKNREGKFIVQMEATDLDPADQMTQWNKKGKKWSRVLSGKTEMLPETEGRNYDEVCRHIISSANSNLGWLLRAEKEWIEEPLNHVSIGLKGIVGKQAIVDTIVGEATLKPWKLVCRPFEPEYPKVAGRVWNRNAPQLRFRPTNADSLSYPTWLKILTHCGKSLNEPIKKNAWAKGAGILTGADYLKVWLASLLQEPMSPLPYLFFHGPQDSGKSIFHESIRDCLITSGVVRADTALTNQQGFNGELENAILGVIEETNMKKNKVAYNRIKDWVTTGELTIHRKGKTPYSVINYLKLIQTSNEYDAVPVMEGDTRIVMMFVDELAPTDKIPKKIFMGLLQKEAADFTAELLRIQIPDSNDRLNVPVITTEEKVRAQQASQNYLEMFLSENYYYIPGEMILFKQLVDDFHEWLPANERDNWTMKTISQALPQNFVKGRHSANNQVMVGNLSKNKDVQPKVALVIRNDKLVPNND